MRQTRSDFLITHHVARRQALSLSVISISYNCLVRRCNQGLVCTAIQGMVCMVYYISMRSPIQVHRIDSLHRIVTVPSVFQARDTGCLAQEAIYPVISVRTALPSYLSRCFLQLPAYLAHLLCMPLLVPLLIERGHPGQRRRHRLLLLIRLGCLQQPLRCPPQLHVVLRSGTTNSRQILAQCQVCVGVSGGQGSSSGRTPCAPQKLAQCHMLVLFWDLSRRG